MSDTGGGHRAAAQAIEEAIEYLHPGGYDIIIEDVWRDHMPPPLNAIPGAYGWITGPGLPFWRLLWRASTPPRVRHYGLMAVAPLIRRQTVQYLSAIQPDLVVSVHPLMNHLGLAGLKAAGLKAPFITVITDMVTFHPLWICPEVTHCIVPTEPARQRALHFGMPAHKVTVHGQPVSLRFASRNGDKETLRRQLTLDIDRHTVLIVGGGEGVGQVFKIARQIARTVPSAQLIIVAGRNRALREELNAVPWEIPTRVCGFVDNMPELMYASDVLITKAGPGAISEAFIAGLPSVISGYIPGQETGNVAYVQENGAGAYTENPADIAALVRRWMTPDNAALKHMAENAARLARPQASLEIATVLCRYV